MYKKKLFYIFNHFISSLYFLSLFPLLISFTQYCDSGPDSLLNITRDKIIAVFSTAVIDKLPIDTDLIRDIKEYHQYTQIKEWTAGLCGASDHDGGLQKIFTPVSDLPALVVDDSLKYPTFVHSHGTFDSPRISGVGDQNGDFFFAALGSNFKPSTFIVLTRSWDSSPDNAGFVVESFFLNQCKNDKWDALICDGNTAEVLAYKIIKGFPIAKTFADQLDYNGTKKLNVKSDEPEHTHAIPIPPRR